MSEVALASLIDDILIVKKLVEWGIEALTDV